MMRVLIIFICVNTCHPKVMKTFGMASMSPKMTLGTENSKINYVYLIRSASNHDVTYAGFTGNPEKQLKQHSDKKTKPVSDWEYFAIITREGGWSKNNALKFESDLHYLWRVDVELPNIFEVSKRRILTNGTYNSLRFIHMLNATDMDMDYNSNHFQECLHNTIDIIVAIKKLAANQTYLKQLNVEINFTGIDALISDLIWVESSLQGKELLLSSHAEVNITMGKLKLCLDTIFDFMKKRKGQWAAEITYKVKNEKFYAKLEEYLLCLKNVTIEEIQLNDVNSKLNRHKRKFEDINMRWNTANNEFSKLFDELRENQFELSKLATVLGTNLLINSNSSASYLLYISPKFYEGKSQDIEKLLIDKNHIKIKNLTYSKTVKTIITTKLDLVN